MNKKVWYNKSTKTKGVLKMAEFKFEIVENLGAVDVGGTMCLELNLVKWGKRNAVLDLRKWNEDHTMMSKGFTLTKAEVEGLRDMLNELCFNEEE